MNCPYTLDQLEEAFYGCYGFQLTYDDTNLDLQAEADRTWTNLDQEVRDELTDYFKDTLLENGEHDKLTEEDYLPKETTK
jgi:hypothetical protein